eukprot:6490469-Prymnesium_polylepis.1
MAAEVSWRRRLGNGDGGAAQQRPRHRLDGKKSCEIARRKRARFAYRTAHLGSLRRPTVSTA